MIKLVVFDVDGVITDGTIVVSATGEELKRVNLKDVDAIFEIKRRGYKIAAITGEDKPIVNYFQNRFPWDYFFKGEKKKVDALKQLEIAEGISAGEICYVGDGKYDVEPVAYVGLGICPRDAIFDVTRVAKVVLMQNAGTGCLWELLKILQDYTEQNRRMESQYLKRVVS